MSLNIKGKLRSVIDKAFPRGSKRRKFFSDLYFKIYELFHGKIKSKDKDYNTWIKNNDPTKKDLEAQRKAKFENNPKISILVPMYNTPKNFFVELVDSLKAQTYSNWELCLGDGSPEKADFVDKIVASDDRIKYEKLDKNEGISGNTNATLKYVTGDFVALLDHDDTLSPDCLYEIVKVINENPEVEFLYTDEDKIDQESVYRYDYHFKSDFAPDLFRTNNYICHFSVYKKELMDKLGGLRKEYDGSQDYDIILRATELTKNIIHIPKILYHWRVHRLSVAMFAEAKPYCYDAAKKALTDHIARLGLKGTVTDGKCKGYYKITYDVIGNPKVSIIIPNKDSLEDLKKCIDSIKLSTYKNYEIIVIENNSETKEIFEYYKEIEKEENIKVVYYEEKGFNYSKINNFGVKQASGEYYIFLNNDTEVIEKTWIEEMLGFCQREDVGAVGAKLLYPDNTIQHAGVVLGLGAHHTAGHINYGTDVNSLGYMARSLVVNNVSAVTAACMMVKKSIYNEVNGFDENFKVSYNDVDFCLKIRNLGKLIVYNPYVLLYHYESKTRGEDTTPEKQERLQEEANRFIEKWKDVLQKGDPYFNPNFRLDQPFYAINPEKIR